MRGDAIKRWIFVIYGWFCQVSTCKAACQKALRGAARILSFISQQFTTLRKTVHRDFERKSKIAL